MKTVITYGTFDLFHQGHYNLLKRAKDLGKYLIVGVTSDAYDTERGKLFVVQSLSERIENVKKTKLADEILVEEYEGQKISDIQKNNVDIFVIGSDWIGKFDFLKEYCNVMYLERTKNISSSELRIPKHKILKIGIIGTGRIANRFVPESKYVSGCIVQGVYSRDLGKAKEFARRFELGFSTDNFDVLIENCDIIYIATPHHLHFAMAKKALVKGKHVLCEKPIVLKIKELHELYKIADKNEAILLECIKTAYAPAFYRLIDVARSTVIGEIKHIDANFTKLVSKNSREFDPTQSGGSLNELGSYPLMLITRLLGKPSEVHFFPIVENKIDIANKVLLDYRSKGATATAYVAIGAKSEGDLKISGTKGYIYVPAPWWKTQEFEIRFENTNKNKKYFFKFDGDGLRYEIAEMLRLIKYNLNESWKLPRMNSITTTDIIEKYNKAFHTHP